MSFSINVSGNRETALKQLENATGQGDLQHFDAAKAAIKSAVMGMPNDTEITAYASGHHDYGPNNPSGDFTLTVKIGRTGTTGSQEQTNQQPPAKRPPAKT